MFRLKTPSVGKLFNYWPLRDRHNEVRQVVLRKLNFYFPAATEGETGTLSTFILLLLLLYNLKLIKGFLVSLKLKFNSSIENYYS